LRIKDDKRKVKLIFFKESGKYYTYEFNEYPKDMKVYEIIENIEMYEKRYQGMYIVLEFYDNDDIGFPCMILPERRCNEKKRRII
jgi:hypothetical protein